MITTTDQPAVVDGSRRSEDMIMTAACPLAAQTTHNHVKTVNDHPLPSAVTPRPLLVDFSRQESFNSDTTDATDATAASNETALTELTDDLAISEANDKSATSIEQADQEIQTTVDNKDNPKVTTINLPIHAKHEYVIPSSVYEKTKADFKAASAAAKAITTAPFTFECAFGVAAPIPSISTSSHKIVYEKHEFVELIKSEILAVGDIQAGLTSYMREINSRKYHKFSLGFLLHQNRATVVTIHQLDTIVEHLKTVLMEVESMGCNVKDGHESNAIINHEHEKSTEIHKSKSHDKHNELIHDVVDGISQHLIDAFHNVKPWIARTRTVLHESHVFYKINYVIGAEKECTH